MVINSLLPIIPVLVPLLGAVMIPTLGEKIEKHVNQFTVFVTILAFLAVLMTFGAINKGDILQTIVSTGFKIDFVFQVDALGLFVGFISVFIWMLTSIYSVEYMANRDSLLRYNMFSLLSLAGMLGVVFAGNLFSLYLVFELLTVASYVLVIQEENPKAMKAGAVYLFMGISSGLILLLSILGTNNSSLSPYVFWGYIIGFGVKAGLFPFHVWVPDAYSESPSPASALFAGVMKKAGAYGILRTIYSIVGMESLRGETMLTVLVVFSLISIFFGSAVAMSQVEIKKMLAYSSIAQIGYIVLGFALLTPMGAMGGIIHILNHALIKTALFLCAGIFIYKKDIRNLSGLEGIGRRMPITTACFTIAGLSIIGFPPFNGFVSKWFLAAGSLDVVKYGSHNFYVGIIALGTLLLSSFMNLIYYGPVIYKAWFGSDVPCGRPGERAGTGTCPYGTNDEQRITIMLVPLVILTAGIVFFGIFPQFPVLFAERIVNGFFCK